MNLSEIKGNEVWEKVREVADVDTENEDTEEKQGNCTKSKLCQYYALGIYGFVGVLECTGDNVDISTLKEYFKMLNKDK